MGRYITMKLMKGMKEEEEFDPDVHSRCASGQAGLGSMIYMINKMGY